MDRKLNSNSIKEIQEREDIIEPLGKQAKLEEQSEIIFMVEEIEAMVPPNIRE